MGRYSWHLNEELTGFSPITRMAECRPSEVGIFDHFPVKVVFDKVLEREKTNDSV